MRFAKIFNAPLFPLATIFFTLALTGCKVGFESGGSNGNGGGGNGADNEIEFIGPSTWRVELNRRDDTFELTHRAEPGANVDMTITGTYNELNSGFIRLTVQDAGQSAALLKATFTALNIADDYLLLLPIENNSDQIIATVEADECPENDITGNWIVYDTATGADASSEEDGFLGTYRYTVSSGTGLLLSNYSLETLDPDENAVTFETDACDDGISENDTAVQYVSTNSAALVHRDTDEADTSQLLFVMDAKEIATRAELDGDDYVGFYYDATFAVGAKSIAVSLSCEDGDCEMKEVVNIDTGLLSDSSYDISFDTPGSPDDGFITGTISDPNENEGKIVCTVDISFQGEDQKVWACVGQSPSNNAQFINLFVTSD